MAHTSCPNGHDMWDGDGKPVVLAFRVNFFRDFMKLHPDLKFGDESEYQRLEDYVYDYPGENLDCWYCDKCKGLTVFLDSETYYFKRFKSLPKISIEELAGWEDYIAMHYAEDEAFQEFCEGKTPAEAIEQYDFKYRYKVSPDKKQIYAIDKEGKIAFGYFRSCYYKEGLLIETVDNSWYGGNACVMDYDTVRCPLVDREIDIGDCVVISDIGRGMFKEECAPVEFRAKKNWKDICTSCKYSDY